ncbi:alkaline-phosphatase-like protein [Kalaharituber pfeilii]|nr:alkaline-phosphatase-like protein [Kalaharituber pfeilii]
MSWPDRGYYYCLMVISLLSAKLMHLFSHFTALPLILFLLYLPTFLLLDLLVVFGGRALFKWSKIGGIILSCLVTSTAAAQIGFFIETGGEIRWSFMLKVMREPEGFFGMLMSGFPGLALTIGIFGGIAWLFNPGLYNITWRFLRWTGHTIYPPAIRWKRYRRNSNLREEAEGLVSGSEQEKSMNRQCSFFGLTWGRVGLIAYAVTMIVLLVVRPSSPYRHLSGTLPFTIFEGLWTTRSEFCEPIPWDEGAVEFPYPDLISNKLWTLDNPDGRRGWRPGSNVWQPRERPDWLPEHEIPGFGKFYRKNFSESHPPPPPPHEHRGHGPPPPPHRRRLDSRHLHERGHPPPPPPMTGYDPAQDPLKISNMDEPILEQLQRLLEKKRVPIRNVVILTLESTRKDVFPLMKDGTLYNQLVESRGGSGKLKKRDESAAEWADLSELSRIAELVTGQDAGFGPRDIGANLTSGGINVNGVVTGSTFTLKSLLGSHCGVNPLAVDFLEELETEVYQPCLAQVLDLFNFQQNQPGDGDAEWPWLHNSTWRSVYMQAATAKFDRQAPFLEQIGFKETMVREQLQAPSAKYPPKNPELNYFGYSETELKPYMRDLFLNAKANNERVFLSHLTSSTHHPWATPPEFGPQQQYWGGKNGGSSAWNRYLNSIKWGDQWVQQVLELLKEVGAEDETLVVIIGDHGFGFGGETNAKTTYANPHIANFWVPLVFRHPLINLNGPGDQGSGMIQINATMTSMSIVPTILDLLVTTGSLRKSQHKMARVIQNEYEGQSLIRHLRPEVEVSYATADGRTVKTTRSGLNFGVINPGGTLLSVISQSPRTPYRLVLPVCENAQYTVSDLRADKYEAGTGVLESWEKGEKLWERVEKRFGSEAREWVERAERIAGWSMWEGRRRWGYDGGTRREDRGAGHNEDGKLEKDHWWDT